ncbi:DJ-1/PfpI family protein [Kribbella sp. NPDC026596]|uniref:DJ-1/PfpI family protein n=1 Tax=Kribbella sp. NPDC026596 TaxID=3155122 RepID=UPI0033E26415
MLILDFDGVICDALEECALVTWFGLLDRVPPEPGPALLDQVPAAFVQRFAHVRNYSRLLDHFAVAGLPAAAEVRTQAEFDKLFASLDQREVAEFVARATAVRNRLRETERDFWLGLHTLYDGVPQLLRRHAGKVAVVTAKDEPSVWEILRRYRLDRTVTAVVGECARKPEAVRRLARQAGVSTSDLIFIDDNLTNTVRVRGTGAQVFWAQWGYQIPEHRAEAARQGIRSLELSELGSVQLAASRPSRLPQIGATTMTVTKPDLLRRNGRTRSITPEPEPETPLIRSIGVLAYDKVSEQDCLTPLEIFKGAAMVISGAISPWERETAPESLEVQLVAVTPGVVTMQMGTQVVPDAALDDTRTYDLLYVPGGVGSGEMAKDERVLELVRRHHDEGKVVAANCSGVGVLARAGILGGSPITCVAAVARGLRGEGYNVPTSRRMWIGSPEERIWTATGSYGVNGSAVAIVAHYLGREVGTIVSMMFDTLSGLGEVIFEPVGPEFYEHPELEKSFQDLFEDMLLPAS